VAEVILFLASVEKARYSEIKKQKYVVGDRSLSHILKELQRRGLIHRDIPNFKQLLPYRQGKTCCKTPQRTQANIVTFLILRNEDSETVTENQKSDIF